MATNYHSTIGLEIHAELKTATKMFCRSKNDPDETRPNVNVCPVCLGHPGILPVINREAVRQVLRVGLALGGELADYSEFDRKNYFYPDIPKGYQISQYQYPLVRGGSLAGVTITRVHLEEDTARSIHDDKNKASLIDFNRAGVPLMELVTEPVITSAKQAGDFARELHLLLRYLEASEANMEKGQMRIEANVSLNLGTKVEIKNLNSFRSVERAIEYELARQQEVLEQGGKIIQETRGFDENNGTTFSQRVKESSHDYRYFPDPDLPKLKLSEIAEFNPPAGGLKETLPELPWQKRERYRNYYQLPAEDIEQFVQNYELGLFFEHVARHFKENLEQVKLAANYILSDLVGYLKEDTKLKLPDPDNFAELIDLVNRGELSSRGAKDTLKLMLAENKPASEIAKKQGLFQQSDEGALWVIVDKVIAAHPGVVADFKRGKQAALQFLIGQGIKESKGAANPAVLKRLFESKFNS